MSIAVFNNGGTRIVAATQSWTAGYDIVTGSGQYADTDELWGYVPGSTWSDSDGVLLTDDPSSTWDIAQAHTDIASNIGQIGAFYLYVTSTSWVYPRVRIERLSDNVERLNMVPADGNWANSGDSWVLELGGTEIDLNALMFQEGVDYLVTLEKP